MKKTIFLSLCITTSLVTLGCNANQPIPIDVPPAQSQTYQISEPAVNITVPYGYKLEKNINEPNRRGSFISYDFQSEEKYSGGKPFLAGVLFSSKKSIENFIEECKKQGIENFCFEGPFPTPESFEAEKKAISDKKDYKDRKNLTFKDQQYLVNTFRCQGDSCVIREYTTFFQDNRVDFLIITYPDTAPTETITDDAKADELFEQIKIQPY